MIPSIDIAGVRVPDFSQIHEQDWDGFLDQAYRRAEEEGQAIKHNPESPTFQNTFLAMEQRLARLWDVVSVFSAVQNAHATEGMQELAERWLPRFDEQNNRFMDSTLAARCKQAASNAGDLDEVDQRLVAETLRKFERSGAFLEGEQREEFLELSTRLSQLGLEFARIHQDNSNCVVFIDGALPGVDEDVARAARAKATAAGRDGLAAICLNASEVDAIVTQCEDRNTRKAIAQAFANRGRGLHEGDTDTSEVARNLLDARARLARLLGYDNWAAMATHERMAGTPEAASALVRQTWELAQPLVARDLDIITRHAQANGHDGPLEAWDLDFWRDRAQAELFMVDSAQVKRHLSLPNVRQQAFDAANRLFGITFEQVQAPTYHDHATPFLVRDRDGSSLGLLYVDDALRPTKSSGAWMEMMTPAYGMDGGQRPVVINVCNFPSGSEGKPALLSMDEAVTAYHELGHALHALLTQGRYPSLAGTMVYGDFVELQSQLMENWIRDPQALAQAGRDWETGQPMGEHLARQIGNAQQFGQAIDQSRYLLSAMLDMQAHLGGAIHADLREFEEGVIAKVQAGPITPRHRLNHFTHLFAGATGGEYSAGYYSYLWAEVLEADAFEAWKEAGDLFDADIGARARETIYARGNEVAPDALYRSFRGRDPDPAALARKMGAKTQAQPSLRP